MLKTFEMEDCKPVITPMQTSCKLSKDDDSKSTDQRQYRSMIGSLLLLSLIFRDNQEIMSRGPQVLDMEYREQD
jgi:hypothetical protein